MNDLITRHANLVAGIQHCHATGKPVPDHVYAEVTRIENRAQAMFDARQLEMAQRASQSLQAQILQQRAEQEVVAEGNARTEALNKTAKAMTGFDLPQLNQQSKGEAYTVKSKQEPLNKLKERVGSLAKGRFGMSGKKFHSAADRYEKRRRSIGHGQAQDEWAKKHGPDFVNALEAYLKSNTGLEIDFRSRVAPDDEELTVETDPQTHRKAQIAEATAFKAIDDGETLKFMSQEVNDEYYDRRDPGDAESFTQKVDYDNYNRRADIAEAFDTQEAS